MTISNIQESRPQPVYLAPLPRASELSIIHNDLASIKASLDAWIDSRQSFQNREQLLGGMLQDYEIRSYSLTTARTDEAIYVKGDFLHAWTDGTLTGVGVKLNNRNAGLVYFDRRNELRLPFWALYLTNTAQAGKTLDLYIGGAASADATSQFITAQFENKVSAILDSTVVTLAIGATYTGAQFSVETYGKIVGSVYSDVAGTLYVEQANDGTNYDVQSSFAYVGGTLIGFSVEIVATNARIRYTNGGTIQAAFRLYARARRV